MKLRGERHGLLAVGGLADHVEALFEQHLAQVEPDQRLVLGDDDPQSRARRSRPTGINLGGHGASLSHQTDYRKRPA